MATWAVRALLALVVMTAIGVSYSVYKARQLTDESQRLQRQQTKLESEWSQLLLEHSTWGSYARVERLAREKLGMKLPKDDERVLIKP
ncbi:MAG: cell division protein FtsL [Alcanivorax sp.]|nr:cell division protein FtsL [Alcanivorax sp.]